MNRKPKKSWEKVRKPLPKSGGVGRLVASIYDMRPAALAKPGGPGGLANMIRCVESGWRFLLSFDESCALWVFSAQLDPIRNTTMDDWRFLGVASAAVGVPPNTQPLGDSVRTAPESVHKWMWVAAAPRTGGSP